MICLVIKKYIVDEKNRRTKNVKIFFLHKLNTFLLTVSLGSWRTSEILAKVSLEFFVIFGALILLTVVVFVDILKLILIPNEAYWEAMTVVPILLLAYLFLGVYHNLSVWYKITDRTKFGAYISIFGALITLLINTIFIPKFGYMASAIATLFAYTAMALTSYILGKKYYSIPYNLKKMGLYLALSIIFSALSFYLFREQYFVGILFILIFFIWLYSCNWLSPFFNTFIISHSILIFIVYIEHLFWAMMPIYYSYILFNFIENMLKCKISILWWKRRSYV